MLCPVWGERFGVGVRRCPTHDVELVDAPPDDRPLADRLSAPAVARVAFVVLVLVALVYAVASVVVSLLFALEDSDLVGALEVTQIAQTAALPVMYASLAVLGAIVLLRAYAALGARSGAAATTPTRGRHPRAMGFLLVVAVSCTVVWGVTDALSSKQQVEYGPLGFGASMPPPSDALVTLLTINFAAYAGAVGSLAVMGGILMVAGYESLPRGGSRRRE